MSDAKERPALGGPPPRPAAASALRRDLREKAATPIDLPSLDETALVETVASPLAPSVDVVPAAAETPVMPPVITQPPAAEVPAPAVEVAQAAPVAAPQPKKRKPNISFEVTEEFRERLRSAHRLTGHLEGEDSLTDMLMNALERELDRREVAYNNGERFKGHGRPLARNRWTQNE